MRAILWLLALVLAPAAQPDFSGTWIVPDRQLVITQDAAQITITETRAGREQRSVYRMDGFPSTNETLTVQGEKWTNVSQAQWVTSALVIITTTTRESTGGSWDWMMIYHLSDTGLHVTTFDATLTAGPMTAMETVAFTKKQTSK